VNLKKKQGQSGISIIIAAQDTGGARTRPKKRAAALTGDQEES